MKDEYIIINKTAIQKRIEKLEKEEEDEFFDEQKVNNLLGQIHALKQILSQSTPLISEIEKAFDAGNKRGWSGYPNTDNWTQPNKQNYISNLKLDI